MSQYYNIFRYAPIAYFLFPHKNFWKYHSLYESLCSLWLLKARVFLNFTSCWILKFTAVLKDRIVLASASSCPLLRHFVNIMRNALVYWTSKLQLLYIKPSSAYITGYIRCQIAPFCIYHTFFTLSYFVSFCMSFIFKPIHWVVPQKSLIQFIMLLFCCQNSLSLCDNKFIPLFVRRDLSPLYYFCDLMPTWWRLM